MKYLLLLLVGIFPAARAEESYLRLTKELVAESWHKWALDSFSDDQKSRMIAELQRARTNAADVARYGRTLTILAVNLGDEVLIKELTGQKFLDEAGTIEQGSYRELRHATHPSIILHLAPYLFRDESPSLVIRGESSFCPPSVAAANVIVNVLTASPVFPQETRKWAGDRSAAATVSDEHRRKLIRVFWMENQEHFRTRNYHLVRPPAASRSSPMPESKPVVTPDPITPAIARPPAKRSSTAVPSSVVPPTTRPQSQPAAPELSAAPLWPWLLLAGAGLASWLAWRSR